MTNAGAGVTTFGTVVGTGNTAPTINDYVMETPIAHGAGAGQLQYGAVSWGAPSSDASVSQFTITRNFANGSGGDITVNEIGLIMNSQYGDVELNYLTVRDVVGGGILVPDGETLTVNYRIQATV